MQGTKSFFNREPQEGLEERIRIFEDEIINRVKLIQNFVKSLDGRVRRNRAQCKSGQHVQDSHRKSQHLPSSSRHSLDESEEKRGGQISEAEIKLAVKEAIRWDLEVVEKKSEDRFREIEALIKKLGVRMDNATASLQNEVTSEFQNVKMQFEDFGNTIYERTQQEV